MPWSKRALAAAGLLTAGPLWASAADPLYDFKYSYPAEVRAIPPLRAVLDGEAARDRTAVAKAAAQDKSDAAKDGRSFLQYSESHEWKVVADLPRFLSLSEEGYQFSGGAHGSPSYAGLVWDRQAKARRAPMAFFISRQMLRAAIQARFCDLLDGERSKRRGERVNRASGDEFDKCIDPTENTLLLGSSSHSKLDRIGIVVGPYAAGSYAEGPYEITMPVSPAILAAVKPEFRSYFALGSR